ncbi:MAG: bifunctional serine/threonine-protein kinase/formylglycine-generating enzyme family protein [Gemmatimonadales bacterium]
MESIEARSIRTPPDNTGLINGVQIAELGERLQRALGGDYSVERPIGHGGFAFVFLVRDLTLKRALAVKVISPELILSKTVLERFRREAETIAQLSHAHIVPVHFVGHQDDLFYLTMTFVDGESLADRLEREGALPIEEAARILKEVASALELAHRRSVIHRDIKPHNVLLEKETGRALLTDFGIARTAEGGTLTATGMVVGTPAYMSPEQVTGDKVDHRADIYALGVLGYEMLAGRPPFTGATPQAMLYQRVAHDPEPIERVNPDVPEWLSSVVNGCLASDPAKRIDSAGEIARALGATTPVSGSQAMRRLKRPGSRVSPAVALFAFLAVVVGGALYLVFSGGGGQRGQTAEAPSEPAGPVVPPGMIAVPGGAYAVGASDGQEFARPEHRVTIDSFAIGRTEVPVGQYAEFMAATQTPAPVSPMPDSQLPVTRVMWLEARDYCAWRYDGGRLPTEEEWEIAARGPPGLRYPWSDTDAPAPPNTRARGLNRLAPAGYSQHALGIFDLLGNVWEWTSSRAVPYPGGIPAPRSDGTYVIRGGAFDSDDRVATATYRGYMPPATSRQFLDKTGFRCALSLGG